MDLDLGVDLVLDQQKHKKPIGFLVLLSKMLNKSADPACEDKGNEE